MQDIGGCRAVLPTVKEVNQLQSTYTGSSIKHELIDERDYIASPKGSGYRGIHLVYRYYSDRKQTYNGHRIEVQIRSNLQHAWATAVEIVGTLLQSSLKSSEGPGPWLDFFSHVGTAFAHVEGTPTVPGTPEDPRELRKIVGSQAKSLDVFPRLRTYGTIG